MEIWGGNQAFDNALSVPGVDAWVYSQPYGGSERGGDIHYVSLCGGNKIARFAVADVSGHGASVGELASRLRSLMKSHINKVDQTRFLRALNREFEQMAQMGQFATAILVTYFAPTDHLVVCNAGHPPPLWYRAADGQWRYLQHEAGESKGPSNLPLGIVAPTEYYQFAVRLGKDDVVLVYSDSLSESMDASGRMLGSEGLLNLVRSVDVGEPQRIKDAVLQRVDDFRGGGPQQDDVTLMVLHHNAAPAGRQSVGEMLTVIGKMVGLIRV
jgi:serine phosphatase RsbU (regulator of sigma subunit)